MENRKLQVVIWRKGANNWDIFPLGEPLKSLKVCDTSEEARAYCEYMSWEIHTDASKEVLKSLD